jgi:hypothetical protein
MPMDILCVHINCRNPFTFNVKKNTHLFSQLFTSITSTQTVKTQSFMNCVGIHMDHTMGMCQFAFSDQDVFPFCDAVAVFLQVVKVARYHLSTVIPAITSLKILAPRTLPCYMSIDQVRASMMPTLVMSLLFFCVLRISCFSLNFTPLLQLPLRWFSDL